MFKIKETTQHCHGTTFVLLLSLISLPSAARADAVTDWNAYGVSA